MAGANQGDINLLICLPLTHFIGNKKSNCFEYSFMNTLGFMFGSFNQSVSVRDSLNLFKLSSLNERLKSFFSLLCGKT